MDPRLSHIPCMTITPRLQRAIDFSREAHNSINQVRKVSGLPYYTHPEAVMDFLISVGVEDEDTLIAAIGHDWLEDVYPKNPYYSPETISELFGASVLGIIFELTDVFTPEAFPQYNRAERKKQEAFRLSAVSDEATLVKLADIWHNSQTMDALPGFGKVWGKEKQFMLATLSTREPSFKKIELAIRKEINV